MKNRWQLKKIGEKNFYYLKKTWWEWGLKERLYLLIKLWTQMILDAVYWSWKALQTSRRGWRSSIKTLHSEKLLNVTFSNWKQCTTIMNHISFTWDSNAPSFTETESCLQKRSTFVSSFFTLGHLFSSCMVNINPEIHLKVH